MDAFRTFIRINSVRVLCMIDRSPNTLISLVETLLLELVRMMLLLISWSRTVASRTRCSGATSVYSGHSRFLPSSRPVNVVDVEDPTEMIDSRFPQRRQFARYVRVDHRQVLLVH